VDYEDIAIHALGMALERHVAKREARQYIVKTFRPSRKRHPCSIYSLKFDFERKAGRYISEPDYSKCLRQCGLKVVGGRVYAKEVNTSQT
jgi:hypothetical protein